ncbi:hypothetical protein EW026_g2171 [Hermanssonia centrifuga]|uniref:SPRY-domain-containing protein n=1 Tax=Hermanssonia centrifuga TaxID=98765 RepID=A0A4S4KQ24_9APHY|nr:hypothetical protein EW026_g2171 [Hermanssonia centrifuga]
MTTRASRSASIPIPGSNSAARNIENVISMPFITTSTTSRPRLVSNTRLQVSASPERMTTARVNVSTSPVRSFSGSYSASLGRSPISVNTAVFEPRIIRSTAAPHTSDPTCFPTASSPAVPTLGRTRRQSVARLPTVSLTSPGTPRTVAQLVSTPSTTPSAQPFRRPAYLDHSALRDLLFTDAVPVLSTTEHGHGAHGPASRMSTPAPYAYLRREHTPAVDTDDESNASPPPSSSRVTPAPPHTTTPGAFLSNPVLHLPTRWSDQDRHGSLTVSTDGRELTFYGPSCTGDRDSAAARANYPIPPACGIYYYEVEILQKGSKGYINIGFSSSDIRLSRQPGWEKGSWGYNSDDGWIYPGRKEGNPYGPTFDSGDIIGCGVDFSQNRAFYTKNGAFLGMVFENVGKGVDIYPSIGLRHTSESIRVNFGHAPFKYAIEDHVHAQRNAVWANIQSTRVDLELLQGKNQYEGTEDDERKENVSVPTIPRGGALEEEQIKAPMRKLVLSYLAHHGYARTARAFQAQCESAQESTETAMDTDDTPRPSRSRLDAEYDLRARIDIVNAVLKGDIDSAITQTQVNHPSVLEREQGLMLFKLRCRKFVELILEASEALKKVQAEEQERMQEQMKAKEMEQDGLDGSGAMDVDEPSPDAHLATSTTSLAATPPHSPTSARDTSAVTTAHRHPSPSSRSSPVPASSSSIAAKEALHTAINYGQSLEANYKNDVRPEVRNHLKRTFGVVAYADPLAAGGEVAEMAGQEARARLANELNQAILESQGKPAHPALETLYRQTAACVMQLGLLGVGSAAFADMGKEFLEA